MFLKLDTLSSFLSCTPSTLPEACQVPKQNKKPDGICLEQENKQQYLVQSRDMIRVADVVLDYVAL